MKKTQQRVVKQEKLNAQQKLVARVLAKDYLNQLKPRTLRLLAVEGLFNDPFLTDYYSQVAPWLQQTAISMLDTNQDSGNVLKKLLDEKSKAIIKQHKDVLKKERKRKADIIAERERKLLEEQIARDERRKIRAEKRRIRDLKLLQDHIAENIVKKGIESEEILKQDICEVHGYLQGQEIVGLIGGLLTEMAIVFTAVQESLEEKQFITDKNAYIFTVMYIGEWMKQSTVSIFIGPKTIEFLTSKGIKADEIYTLDPSVVQEFSDLYKSYEDEDEIMKTFREKAETLGIEPTAMDFIRASILKLLLRKPTDNDPQGRNMAAKGKLHPVSIPEPFDKTPPTLKAIAKIMLPKPEAEDESKESDEDTKRKPDPKKKSKGKGKKPEIDRRDESGYEDKVIKVKPLIEDTFVYVIHEVAAKEVRADICEFMKKQFAKDLDGIDMNVVKEKADIIGQRVETEFFEMFKDLPVFEY